MQALSSTAPSPLPATNYPLGCLTSTGADLPLPLGCLCEEEAPPRAWNTLSHGSRSGSSAPSHAPYLALAQSTSSQPTTWGEGSVGSRVQCLAVAQITSSQATAGEGGGRPGREGDGRGGRGMAGFQVWRCASLTDGEAYRIIIWGNPKTVFNVRAAQVSAPKADGVERSGQDSPGPPPGSAQPR